MQQVDPIVLQDPLDRPPYLLQRIPAGRQTPLFPSESVQLSKFPSTFCWMGLLLTTCREDKLLMRLATGLMAWLMFDKPIRFSALAVFKQKLIT